MKKKVLRALGVLAMVVAIAITCRAQTREITILHSNDTHSNMVPISGRDLPVPRTAALDQKQRMAMVVSALRTPVPVGTAGIARMATLIGQIKGANPNVLALNAGDVFVGTFEFNKYLGYPELKIMEGLYDAMCLGNHETDLGLDVLTGILGGQLAGGPAVGLPILCANLDVSGIPLANFVQPSIIKTVNGVKIGIFGLINADAQNYSPAVAGRITDPFTAAATQVQTLRGQGCQVVIALSHLGTAWDTQALAVYVPGIDVIVGGHSHNEFTEPILRNGKIIVQAGEFGRFLGELKINVAADGAVTLASYVLHPVDSTVPENPAVKAQVNELREGIVLDPRFGPVFSQIVAIAAHEVSKPWPADGQNRDSALGNLVADAMLTGVRKAGFQADFVLDSFGYTAASIPAGKVVGEDIMRAVPYGYDPESGLGFKVVVAPLPGALVLGGLEYAAGMVTLTNDLAIQVAGITYAYDSSKPPAGSLGEISRLDPMSVKVGDEYVAANQGKYYMVVMSDQVFNFLNGLVGGSLQCYQTNQLEYNLVRDYMWSLKTVDYHSEGRVKDTAPLAVK